MLNLDRIGGSGELRRDGRPRLFGSRERERRMTLRESVKRKLGDGRSLPAGRRQEKMKVRKKARRGSQTAWVGIIYTLDMWLTYQGGDREADVSPLVDPAWKWVVAAKLA